MSWRARLKLVLFALTLSLGIVVAIGLLFFLRGAPQAAVIGLPSETVAACLLEKELQLGELGTVSLGEENHEIGVLSMVSLSETLAEVRLWLDGSDAVLNVGGRLPLGSYELIFLGVSRTDTERAHFCVALA